MTVQVKHVTASSTGQWWVVNTSPASGSPTVYTVLQGTETQADNLPNGGGVSGPYSSQAAADAVAAKEPQNATSGTGIPGLSVTPGGSYTGALASPFTGLAAIGDFFSRLGQANTWIRVGETVLGLVLLAVGVARMTRAVPIATKVAKTAGAVL